MPTAILGKKLGMTRVFDGEGNMVPVTVIEAGPNTVLQVRTKEKDGYEAVQLGFDDVLTGEQWDRIKQKYAEKKLRGGLKGLKRPEIGHYLTTGKGTAPKKFVREVFAADGESFEAGQQLNADTAESWGKVDVIGTSKGRGTMGTMRAWNFSSGPNTHGSKNRRNPGSIGMAATPKRVLKGQKMYTRWGNERATVRNLDVVSIDKDHNLILVRGGVPGPTNGYVVVRKAVACKVAKA
ncbi:MAG: 50S ribosomal protein L3 [Planctomycetota bacterium]